MFLEDKTCQLLFAHNHVVCAFKSKELKKLNDELLNFNTQPIIINDEIREID